MVPCTYHMTEYKSTNLWEHSNQTEKQVSSTCEKFSTPYDTSHMSYIVRLVPVLLCTRERTGNRVTDPFIGSSDKANHIESDSSHGSQENGSNIT